eukprot:SAG22_NODE_1863_length_3419_cov_2.175301_2_plen_355_part_00
MPAATAAAAADRPEKLKELKAGQPEGVAKYDQAPTPGVRGTVADGHNSKEKEKEKEEQVEAPAPAVAAEAAVPRGGSRSQGSRKRGGKDKPEGLAVAAAAGHHDGRNSQKGGASGLGQQPLATARNNKEVKDYLAGRGFKGKALTLIKSALKEKGVPPNGWLAELKRLDDTVLQEMAKAKPAQAKAARVAAKPAGGAKPSIASAAGKQPEPRRDKQLSEGKQAGGAAGAAKKKAKKGSSRRGDKTPREQAKAKVKTSAGASEAASRDGPSAATAGRPSKATTAVNSGDGGDGGGGAAEAGGAPEVEAGRIPRAGVCSRKVQLAAAVVSAVTAISAVLVATMGADSVDPMLTRVQ